jgi:hypothetical protein
MTALAAAVLLTVSFILAAWCFRGIVRRYRTLLGFPWLPAVGFAAAAVAAVFALHALLGH